MTFRPILGAAVKQLSDVRLPTLASYKLNGIRAIWWGAEFMSRSMKTIPNRQLQRDGAIYLNSDRMGWDGELIVGKPNAFDVFPRTESVVMSAHKLEPIHYYVFDHAFAPYPFEERLEGLINIADFVVKLDQNLIENYDDLAVFEEAAVAQGYEGIVCRAPQGHYKNGRSTLREQLLIKVKRFIDEECPIIGFEELRHNANPATLDERGYTTRSSHQDGKILSGLLGAIIVNWRGHELRVGTGFTSDLRREIWNNQSKFLGLPAKIKYFPVAKTLPVSPVFLGIRQPGI